MTRLRQHIDLLISFVTLSAGIAGAPRGNHWIGWAITVGLMAVVIAVVLLLRALGVIEQPSGPRKRGSRWSDLHLLEWVVIGVAGSIAAVIVNLLAEVWVPDGSTDLGISALLPVGLALGAAGVAAAVSWADRREEELRRRG